MKPTRLFLSALAMTALASCSSSEDIPTPTPQMIDTYLSITATAGEVKTKTPENETGTDNENFIKKLTALVFAEGVEGAFIASKDTVIQAGNEDKTIDKITNIKVKVSAMEAGKPSETKLQVVLIANADVSGITKFSDLKTQGFGSVINLGTKGGQPMSSAVLSVTGLVAGGINWVLDTGVVQSEEPQQPTDYILLTRYAARVQLESLRAYFTENNKGASFTLTNVSLINVSGKSLFVAPGADVSLYPGHDESNPFYRGFPETIDRKDYYIAEGTYDVANFTKKYIENNKITANKETITEQETGNYNSNVLNFNAEGLAQPLFYAFEYKGEAGFSSGSSNKIYTMMVITGNFTLADGRELGARSFRIPIKISEAANATYGVARNTIYKVKATLTGEGTKNPDENMLNAMINFKITVEDWTVVNQQENDVN